MNFGIFYLIVIVFNIGVFIVLISVGCVLLVFEEKISCFFIVVFFDIFCNFLLEKLIFNVVLKLYIYKKSKFNFFKFWKKKEEEERKNKEKEKEVSVFLLVLFFVFFRFVVFFEIVVMVLGFVFVVVVGCC